MDLMIQMRSGDKDLRSAEVTNADLWMRDLRSEVRFCDDSGENESEIR